MMPALPRDESIGLPDRKYRMGLGQIALGVSVAVLAAPGCSATVPDERSAGATSESIVGGLADPMIATAGQIVNRYTALAQNAAAGATSIMVADATQLRAAAGDLLFISQMQGATVNGSNTNAFGTVAALNGAGSFELVTVASVNGDTITVSAGCGIRNTYSATAHTQVIWVPQYQSLTVAASGSITAPAWDGTTGGVAVIEAQSVNLGRLTSRRKAFEAVRSRTPPATPRRPRSSTDRP
jgi:large repetitive protein